MSFLILDTETTGLGPTDQIVELSIIDETGYTVIDTFVKPLIKIPHEVTKIHGISDGMVINAPTFPDVYELLKSFIDDKRVFIYNAEFDIRMLKQTAHVHNIDYDLRFVPICVMQAYAKYFGEWDNAHNCYRWQRLVNACQQQGISVKNAHRSLADCRMTLDLIKKCNLYYQTDYFLDFEKQFSNPHLGDN